MLDEMNFQETLKNNPSIDPTVLAEAMRIHKDLLEAGLRGRRFRVAPISRGRRIFVGYPDREDPRVKKLRSRQRSRSAPVA